MDRISLVTPRTDISEEPTARRPTPRSGVAFKDVVTRSASSVVAEAQSMVTALPGGPVLAAAVRSGPLTPSPTASSGPGFNTQPYSPATLKLGGASTPAPTTSSSPSSPNSTSSTPAEGPTAATDGSGTSIDSTIAQSQDMNLYYLQLQESMAAENRSYTACSNVLKTRHDTVKNAIGNIH